jgi:carbamoyl-phosphate synthase small subunit
VTDYSEEFSHWNAAGSLGEWLRRSGVPAICGVDTRALAQHLRENGAMAGKIIVEDAPVEELRIDDYELQGEYGEGDITVCIVGDNIKNNIIRSLMRRGAKVTTDPAAPWDGMVVTGTAGDPKKAGKVVETVKNALAAGKPIFGVCGGDTALALAAGGDTFKMKNGHRGANQPVLKAGTDSALITAQNHGYAVDAASLPKGWEVWYTDLNDGTVEGIRHTSKPFGAVAFHPEATNRPVENDKLYDDFVKVVRDGK